jgi:hypothetical protein
MARIRSGGGDDDGGDGHGSDCDYCGQACMGTSGVDGGSSGGADTAAWYLTKANVKCLDRVVFRHDVCPHNRYDAVVIGRGERCSLLAEFDYRLTQNMWEERRRKRGRRPIVISSSSSDSRFCRMSLCSSVARKPLVVRWGEKGSEEDVDTDEPIRAID